MKQKGFTLIELLAVIVILAIIALIATPIVLNIISDSRESATLQSAQFYMDAVEYSIAQSTLKNINITSGSYSIIDDGNICIGYVEEEKCIGEILKVDVNGEVPNSGYVFINSGKVEEINLLYGEKIVSTSLNQEFFISKYNIGDEIIFNPGDKDRSWSVIAESKDTITLMLNENFKDVNGKNINWISSEDYNTYNTDGTQGCTTNNIPVSCSNGDIDEGPITAFKVLNDLTSNWNIDVIENYKYENSAYKIKDSRAYHGLEIKDGVTTIIDDKGNKNIIPGETKARLATIEEISKIVKFKDSKFTEKYVLEDVQEELDKNGVEIASKEYLQYLATEFGILYKDMLLMGYTSMFGNLLPDFLIKNLMDDSEDSKYYLLSAAGNSEMVYVIGADKTAYLGQGTNDTSTGIRPVIEISKNKLK